MESTNRHHWSQERKEVIQVTDTWPSLLPLHPCRQKQKGTTQVTWGHAHQLAPFTRSQPVASSIQPSPLTWDPVRLRFRPMPWWLGRSRPVVW
jgi:hypothetical protein